MFKLMKEYRKYRTIKRLRKENKLRLNLIYAFLENQNSNPKDVVRFMRDVIENIMVYEIKE